jgi:hypothetical protein
MLDTIRSAIDRRTTLLTRTLASGALLVWFAGELVPPLGEWTRNQGLSATLAVVLIAEVLNRVSELRPKAGPRDLAIFEDQDAAMPVLLNVVQKSPPRSADFMLHSGWTMGELLRELADNKKTSIRVLIQHPDMAQSRFERDQIEACITYLLGVTFAKCPRARLFLYRSPAAARGCLITGTTGTIALGWYRYDKHCAETVQGHVNPFIVGPSTGREGKLLAKMFVGTFEALVSAEDTEEATDGPRGRAPVAKKLLGALRLSLQSARRAEAGPDLSNGRVS